MISYVLMAPLFLLAAIAIAKIVDRMLPFTAAKSAVTVLLEALGQLMLFLMATLVVTTMLAGSAKSYEHEVACSMLVVMCMASPHLASKLRALSYV